jgi:hypothetical protein
MTTAWVPQQCTLPTAERPLRVQEFDELLGQAAGRVERPASDRLRLELPADPAVAARVAELAVREGQCCSFFTFTLTSDRAGLWLDVSVPEAQVSILDALAGRTR